ncbi:MAG: PQ-loop repeat-containing protein [Micropruina sp.]|nr:PQ-loop repeat-containing protein [Micropruina sp.]
MTLAVLVGWSATFVGAVLGFPQLWRLVRTRNVEGLSLFAWQSILVMNLIWFVHGLRIDQPPQLVVNTIGACSTVPIVVLLARATGRSLWRAVLPCLLAAAAIMAIDHFLGSVAFGIAATVPGITATIGQSVELVRAPHVLGVSALFMVLAFVNQVLWMGWGFLIADPGTIITTLMISLLAGLNLVWYVLRRLGLRAFFAPAAEVADARM